MSYKTWKKLLLWDRKNSKVGCQLPRATKMAEILEIEDTAPSLLLPCTTCNRTFRPETLAKHAKVCEKSLMKKRKKFDSAKQRIQGTELAQFLPTAGAAGKKPAVKTEPQSKWKEKDKGAGESVRAVKKPVIRKPEKTLPSKQLDHEQCPHCERNFGPKAFDRHVEWCKEQSTRMRTRSQSSLMAKERLQARTKYRAPLSKTQRALTKEHYSPMRGQRDASPQVSHHSSPFLPHKSPSAEPHKEAFNHPPTLTRSLTQRSGSKFNIPVRTGSQRSSVTKSSRPPSNASDSRPQLEQEDTPNKSFVSSRPKVVNRGNTTEKRDLDKYDPYVSAELQMLELFSEENKKNNNNNINQQEETANRQTLPILDSSPVIIRSSPASAFAKFSPISPVRSPPPDNLSNEIGSENGNNSRRGSNMSLSNLSLCSVISIDSIDCNRNSKQNLRSQSALDPVKPIGVRHVPKIKPDMHQMLYGSSPFVPVENEKNKTLSSTTSSKEDLEACEAELLISMMEFEKMLNTSSPLPVHSSSPPVLHLESSPTLCSSAQPTDTIGDKRISPSNNNEEDIEIKHPSAQVHNVDSAYSSLTRKTPVESGGVVDSSQPEYAGSSKFCHECGARYPIPAAKFCCQCGIRRLTI